MPSVGKISSAAKSGPAARCRKTSISPNTPTLTTDPMIPHTLVLKAGLVIYSVYNGYWYWAGPRSRICAAISVR